MTEENSITHCAGFIVNPTKKSGEVDLEKNVKGSVFELDPKVKEYLQPIFKGSQNFQVKVDFSPESGEQKNEIRALIRNLVSDSQKFSENAYDLAKKFAKVIDMRTNTVLFLVLVGKIMNGHRVLLLTFPKGSVLSAEAEQGKFIISRKDNAFTKESDFFKAAMFEGDVTNTRSFWDGRVEDNQTKQRIAKTSKYWTADFLTVRPQYTDYYATTDVIKGLKQMQGSVKTIGEKQNIISVAEVLKGQAGETKSILGITENLLPDLRPKFLNKFDPVYHKQPFSVSKEIIEREIDIKLIMIDDDITISAPLDQFDKRVCVVKVQDTEEVEATVRGKQTDEKIRSRLKRSSKK